MKKLEGGDMDVAAVLFDMDGTLVDSDAAVERAWRAWADRYDVAADTVLATVHGAPAPRSVGMLRPDLEGDALAEAVAWMLERESTDLDGVVALPGAHALLADLDRSGVPWAVVTSADRRLAAARLGAAWIAPPVLVTVDELGVGKPDPEGYQLAARRLGVDPRACLVVEDSPVGAAAGRASGATVAGLRGLAPPAVDIALDGLPDLAPLLSREVTA